MDALANGDTELVGINDPGEWLAASLALFGYREQVFVLRDEHSTERRSAFEQNVIGKPPGIIGLGRQNFHFTAAKPNGNCRRNVDIHIETEAQGSLPSARSRRRPGES